MASRLVNVASILPFAVADADGRGEDVALLPVAVGARDRALIHHRAPPGTTGHHRAPPGTTGAVHTTSISARRGMGCTPKRTRRFLRTAVGSTKWACRRGLPEHHGGSLCGRPIGTPWPGHGNLLGSLDARAGRHHRSSIAGRTAPSHCGPTTRRCTAEGFALSLNDPGCICVRCPAQVEVALAGARVRRGSATAGPQKR
jgi:hypothetical protein